MPTKLNTIFDGYGRKVPITCACNWKSTYHQNKNLFGKDVLDGYYLHGKY